MSEIDDLTKQAQNTVMDAYNKGKEKGKDEGVTETQEKWNDDLVEKESVWEEEKEELEIKFKGDSDDTFIGGFNYALQLLRQESKDDSYIPVHALITSLQEYSDLYLQLWKSRTHDYTPPPPYRGEE